jgi:NCAIR mutase (PurE)-related protein
MDESRLMKLLRAIERGDVSAGEAFQHFQNVSFDDIGFAKLDLHREARCGVPEAIFCQGKSVAQVQAIARRMRGRGMNLLATRASEPVHRAIAKLAPDAVYCAAARTVAIKRTKHPPPPGEILVLCAGTADIPVAEEARVTAEFLDNRVRAIYDVGVAGLHRLLRFRRELRRANVVIVVAGMEGALASVVGGISPAPVIAVPTSVGYGASLAGVTALLAMLASCAPGVTVVGIDNGFGAACAVVRALR